MINILETALSVLVMGLTASLYIVGFEQIIRWKIASTGSSRDDRADAFGCIVSAAVLLSAAVGLTSALIWW